MLVQMLQGIRDCENDGINTDEKFQEASNALDLRFTTTGCNGHEVELESGGHDRKVTFENRLMYCRNVEEYRLNECQAQVCAANMYDHYV